MKTHLGADENILVVGSKLAAIVNKSIEELTRERNLTAFRMYEIDRAIAALRKVMIPQTENSVE